MYYKTWPLLSLFFVLIFFSFLHRTPVFADPDSFYHARITALMIEGKNIITAFPWLPYTSLGETFTDHHLLYHIFLTPFVALFGPLWGMKVATVLFATTAVSAFWLLAWRFTPLQDSRKKSLIITLFTLSLLLNQTFLLRINLEKIPAVSLLWLLVGVYALLTKKRKLLFFLSFFYVWLHSAWPLLPILSLFTGRRTLILSSFLGALAGLIINPYFPSNISFYLIQIYHIAVITYTGLLPVGAEWQSPGPQIISWNLVALLLFSIAAPLFFARRIFLQNGKQENKTGEEWFLLFTSVFFGVLTLKSARHGEYFTPLATLFGAVVLSPFLGSVSKEKIRATMDKFLHRGFVPVFSLAVFSLLLCVTILYGALQVVRTFAFGQGIDTYKGAAEFLQNASEQNEIIFHDRWDAFYPLWYYNQINRYISGFDPTFLYRKNPELFWMYEKLGQGEYGKNTASLIASTFKSRFVLVEKENTALQNALGKDPTVKKVYGDEKVLVYTITAPSPK